MEHGLKDIGFYVQNIKTARSSLVITSCLFATSRLRVPASVRRVYCRDIHPHMMTWTNQPVEIVWAPTIQNAKAGPQPVGMKLGQYSYPTSRNKRPETPKRQKWGRHNAQRGHTGYIWSWSSTDSCPVVTCVPPSTQSGIMMQGHRTDQRNSAGMVQTSNCPCTQDHKIRDTTNTNGRRTGMKKAATVADTDLHQKQRNHQRWTKQ